MARKWRKPGTWKSSEDKVQIATIIDEAIKFIIRHYVDGNIDKYKRAIDAFEILLITDIDDEYEADIKNIEKTVNIAWQNYTGPTNKRDTFEFQTEKFKALMSLLNRGSHSRERTTEGLADDKTIKAIIQDTEY